MEADTSTKDFISDAEGFADVLNYFIYGRFKILQLTIRNRLNTCRMP